MERVGTLNVSEQHVIDITTTTQQPSPSRSTVNRLLNHSNSTQVEDHTPSTSVAASNANAGVSRNNAPLGTHGQRSLLNSGYWVCTELVITMSQIIAAVVVLCFSRDEQPEAPLFTWVIGYACGCVASLPLLLWRWFNRNRVSDQDPAQPAQSSPTPRFKVFIEYYKMGLDCFFAVWFVVGNVWIFGGHSSFSDAPNLYRLCIVFLTLSCLGYAMPFILCATVCCCLPCIISIMGFREEQTRNRGATTESINSLPTYKFKIKNNKHSNDKKTDFSSCEGGVVAAGTEKEHVISGEDAVCCICLAKYANNDELRELHCSHFFHKNCVDKWLKINASCPLCKSLVGEIGLSPQTEITVSNASQ
ncbi:E3 ubiquitin-protein ligase At1g63170-like isoform X2 [Bidens hawaiensis]|uniref:E3 ubiquitin-protein ligase At1g63170-like isoform X2 n=1 Tax=Bidens hawaiensis TaxID=980011 RepID=UPI004049AE59